MPLPQQAVPAKDTVAPVASVPSFSEANIDQYRVPETGHYAGSNPSGEGKFSIQQYWTPEMQGQLDQLRSEGYGSGRIAKEKEQARIARLSPNVTDPFVQALTEAAMDAPVPVIMGGHSLVSGGMYALIEAAWARGHDVPRHVVPEAC